jgi:hypothetical protein
MYGMGELRAKSYEWLTQDRLIYNHILRQPLLTLNS